MASSNQIELFSFPKCSHCGKEMGSDPRSIHLANGFYDADTKQNVHWKCRDEHYKKKNKTEKRFLYSETPLMINI